MVNRIAYDPQVEIEADFSGGVNNNIHAINIPPGFSVDLQDIDVSTQGLLKIRNGFTQVGGTLTAGANIQGFVHTNQSGAFGGANRKILLADNDGSGANVYYWDGTNAIASQTVFGGGNVKLTNFTAGTEIVMLQAGAGTSGKVYFQQAGTNRPYKLILSTGVLSQFGTTNASMVQGLIMSFWLGRIWVAGRSTEPGSVWYSDPLTDTFDETIQKLQIAAATGRTIVAMKPLRNSQVIVFLDTAIWQIAPFQQDIYGLGTFGFPTLTQFRPEEIDPTIGCVARESVALVGSDMIFLDQVGNIRSLQRTALDASQGTKSLPLSDSIQGFVDNFNKLHISKAAAIVYGNKYYISVPYSSSTSNSKTFVYDITRNSWAGPYSFGASRWVISNVESQSYLYGAIASDAGLKLYRFESGTSDNGTAIPFQYTTRRHTFGEFDREKKGGLFVADFVASTNSTVTVSAALDGGGFATIGNSNIQGTTGTLPQNFPFNLGGNGIVSLRTRLEGLGPFYDIQFQFACEDLDALVKLLRYRVEGKVGEVRGID